MILTAMSTPVRTGQNLPGFIDTQLSFAAHIRNPEVHPRPNDIEARRMQIYVDLFFNNIEGFVSNTFPVSKSILGDVRWHKLVREFVHLHGSDSPYFLQIAEEFLTFLHNRQGADLPEFILELCHYEWVEMSLDVADDVPIPTYHSDIPITGEVVITPYIRRLTYQYAVHEIGPEHQPRQAPDETTYLIVYRDAHEKVKFVNSNAVTHRLLELLEDTELTIVLEQIHAELRESGREISFEQVVNQAQSVLVNLQRQGIVLGGKV